MTDFLRIFLVLSVGMFPPFPHTHTFINKRRYKTLALNSVGKQPNSKKHYEDIRLQITIKMLTKL